MQHKPRYKLMRRILFPYSGEEPLSLKQGLRVMLAWILFFPLCISLLTLVFVVIGSYSLQRMVELLVFAFISSAFIFGILGLLIVSMNNRSARFRQTWKTQRGRQ
jgi:hypothetical protein